MFEYLIKALESFKCYKPAPSRLLIKNWYFALCGSLAYKQILSKSGWWLYTQQTFVGLQDVLKTPSRHVLKTFSTRLQRNNFSSSKTVSKMSCVYVLKTPSKNLGRQKIFTLKTSWRRLGDKQNVYWGYLYLTNLNVYLTNLYFTNLYLTNLRRIQNALIRTQ